MEKEKYELAKLAYSAGPRSVPFLNVYGEDAKIGHTSRRYQMGASHLNVVSTQGAPKTTRLELTAFLLQCMHDRTLKAVRAANDAFVTFKNAQGKNITCRAVRYSCPIRSVSQRRHHQKGNRRKKKTGRPHELPERGTPGSV